MRRPRVLLALLGLTIALAGSEAVVRLVGGLVCADVPGALTIADDALGWRQRPNLRGWATLCRARALRPTLVATDERGFVNPGRPIEKPPGTARILLLGGNVPQGLGVPWSLGLAGMLEGRADARRGRPLEVVDGAMSSFALDQDLLLLRAEGRRVAPDLVLAVLDPVVETSALTPGLIALAGLRAPAKPYFDAVDGALVPLEMPPPEPAPPTPGPGGLLSASALYRFWQRLPGDAGPPQRWLPVVGIPTDATAEIEHGKRVMRAILTALRDESRALGAPLAIVLLPPPRAIHFGEESLTDRVFAAARELDIPAISLALVFRGLPSTMGSGGYVPQTTRFNADGHFVAAHTIWGFLEREHLLPRGVVSIGAPAGGRVPPLSPFPAALETSLWLALSGGAAWVIVAGLAGVVGVWLAAPLPARARRVALVAANLTPVVLMTGGRGAAFALATATALYLAAEVPRAWLRRALLTLVLAGIAAIPIAWLAWLPTERSVPIRLWVGLASATALVRALAYATERRRRDRFPFVDYLGAILFFPTLAGGPIQSTRPLVRALAEAAVPSTNAAVGAHLAAAGRGAARVGLGAAKLVVGPLFLNLVTPDVLASSGDAVTRLRLWAWLGETTLYLWVIYSGLADVGIGLGAMVGVRVPENFRRPSRATDPGALWRRTLVTVTSRLRAVVGRPVARRAGLHAGVVATFLAGALWWGIGTLALYGVFGVRPGAVVGLVAWALVQAAAVLASRRRAPADRRGRLAGWVWTQAVLALAWVPFLAFPFGTIGTILRIYARLVGLR